MERICKKIVYLNKFMRILVAILLQEYTFDVNFKTYGLKTSDKIVDILPSDWIRS